MFELTRAFTNGRGDAFDRVWSDFALPALGFSAQPVRVPAADVLETADEIVVEVDLPGHKTEELQVKVDGDVLTIRGGTQGGARPEGRQLPAQRADPRQVRALVHAARERRFDAHGGEVRGRRPADSPAEARRGEAPHHQGRRQVTERRSSASAAAGLASRKVCPLPNP